METKRCNHCRQEKPVSDFYRNRHAKDGLQGCCKPCSAAHNRASHVRLKDARNAQRRAEQQALREGDPAEYKRWLQAKNLRQNFGLTLDDYEKLLVLQHGVCGICGCPPPEHKRFDVDHEHETGAIRGLLCGRCNRAIGMLDDDPARFSRAASYLYTGGALA